jgi:tyrosyl-tRNA synthetase
MSQSLHNYVAIREEPAVMFGQLMSIPDSLTSKYALLATDMDEAEVRSIAVARGPDAGAAKRRMARAIVALYHGDDAAQSAEAAFDRQFREHEAPDEVPEAKLPADAIDGTQVYLPRVLADLGLAASRSEARRLLAQGGVRVNGEQVSGEELATSELVGALLQVGKRRFVRITT